MATWSTNVGKIALKWWHACRWAKRKGKLPVPDRQKTAGKPQARGSMSDRWVQGYAGEESHSSQAPEKGWSEVSFGLPSWERMAEWPPVATMMGWSRGCHGWDASSKECKHSQVLPNKAAVNDGAHVSVAHCDGLVTPQRCQLVLQWQKSISIPHNLSHCQATYNFNFKIIESSDNYNVPSLSLEKLVSAFTYLKYLLVTPQNKYV